MTKTLLLPLSFFVLACAHAPEAPTPTDRSARESRCNEYLEAAAPKKFTDYDTNKNGSVERAEYLCLTVKRFTALDADHDSTLSPAELKSAGAWKKDADLNRDGSVGLMEYMRRADEGFKAADENRDSTISAGESGEDLP